MTSSISVNEPLFNQTEKMKKESERPKEKELELNILGVKMSYSKAFGIVFLVIFILLFFPGIGISSSGVKGMENKNPKDKQKY